MVALVEASIAASTVDAVEESTVDTAAVTSTMNKKALVTMVDGHKQGMVSRIMIID